MLTKRQKQVLDFVKSFSKKHGYAPSLEEIKDRLELSSISTAHFHISNLKKLGLIRKIKNEPRAIEIKKKKPNLVSIPLLGTIAAGEPIEAIENREDIKVLKSELAKSGEHFALRVSGDSMIKDGIFNGDVVIIREQPVVENGETAVAIINGNEATLKKVYKEKNRFRLQPANPKLKPIFVKSLEIRGKAISVIRHFE